MRLDNGHTPGFLILRLCRRPASLTVALLCLYSVAKGQETRRTPELGVFRSVVAPTDEAPTPASPAFGEPPALWVEAARPNETLENAAVEFVTSLLRMSDVQTHRENPAAGLKLRYEAAEFALQLPVTGDSPLQLFANFGLGVTRLRSREFVDIPGYYRLSETFVSALGGITAKLRLQDNCHVFIGARRFLYVNDADSMTLDEVPDAGQLLDASSWTFPVILGFELRFD